MGDATLNSEKTRDFGEKQIRAIIEAIDESVLLLDRQGRIIAANQVLAKRLGVAQEILTGEAWGFLPEETAEARRATFEQVLQTGAPVETEDVRGGRIFLTTWHPVCDDEGTVIQVAVYGRDITHRRQRNGELKESKEKYRELVETLNDVIFSVDLDGCINYVSPSVRDAIGYEPRDVMGQKFLKLVDSRDHPLIQTAWEDVLNGRLHPSEFRILDRSGGTVWVRTSSRPVFEGGVITGVRGVLSDITEKKLAEQALRESEEQVQAKLEAILSPEGDIGDLDLADIVDAQVIQTIMDDFYRLTKIGVAIIDMKGKVLVATGWQDICTKFHRVHPETRKKCLESDIELSFGVEPGKFKIYRCKNHMWDMATPIMVGGKQLGNLFLSQFLFDDETPDYDVFKAQAQRYGFDEADYLDALKRIPRWSRETIDAAMSFSARFADLISKLSYSNLKLARSLEERKTAEAALKESERRFRTLVDSAPLSILAVRDGKFVFANPAGARLHGYQSPDDMIGLDAIERVAPEYRDRPRYFSPFWGLKNGHFIVKYDCLFECVNR